MVDLPHGVRRPANAAELAQALKLGVGVPVVHSGKQLFPEDCEGVECPVCKTPFQPGDLCTLIPVGPGADEGARRAARMNAPFDVASMIVCWPCVSGEEKPNARIITPPGTDTGTDPPA